MAHIFFLALKFFKRQIPIRGFFIVFLLSSCSILTLSSQSNQNFDIVLKGGRVIDPESGLDAVKNVGILNGVISQISNEDMNGDIIIDASGLVVSPGFIDLHVHGITNKEQEYQLKDGVTSALELEWGVPEIKKWFEKRKDKALINYGASVNWPYYRAKTMGAVEAIDANGQPLDYTDLETLFANLMPTFEKNLSMDNLETMLGHLKSSLEDGAIGIGLPVGYLNGATRQEVFEVYKYAHKLNSLIFSHVRSGGAIAIQQAIANAMLSGASLHIVHMNSMALGEIGLSLEMVAIAQEKGFDVTTEVYPYTAASTGLASAIFDDGWQERLAIGYEDLQLVKTGERLTEVTFNDNRAKKELVIIHMMKPEWIELGVKSKDVMIASDGMPYSKLAHPRTAGTYARVLGKYVREDNVLSLNEAISKMTWLPAKRLESIAPGMGRKGRLQEGADADITVFNADTIIDKATFEGGLEFSEGVKYVIVNGTLLLDNGKMKTNTFPGQPIYGKSR